MIGRIKSWNHERGFGFVANEGGSWFFHQSQVIGEVNRGDEISFWLAEDERRGNLCAVEVQRLESE